MKAVNDDADAVMISAAYGLPCIAVIVDMCAPSQRLIPHSKVAARGALPQFMQICRRSVDAAKSLRMHAGTDQHQISAQLLHYVELAFSPIESAAPVWFR